MRRPRKGWLLPPMLGLLLGLLLALTPSLAPAQPGVAGAELQVFVREGCPHCAAAKAFLPELQKRRPEIQVRLRPLESDPAAIDDLSALLPTGRYRCPWGTHVRPRRPGVGGFR